MTEFISRADPFLLIAIVFIFASLLILRKRWSQLSSSEHHHKNLARSQRFSELHAQKEHVLRHETPEEQLIAQQKKLKLQKKTKAWKRQIIMASLAAIIFLAISSYQTFFSSP